MDLRVDMISVNQKYTQGSSKYGKMNSEKQLKEDMTEDE